MTRISMTDFKGMYRDPNYDGLYHALLACAKAEPGGEVIQIDDAALRGEAFKRQWAEWKQSNQTKVLDSAEQIQKEQREAEEATAKAISEAADKRLNFYLHDEGLLDDDQNVVLLKQWFETNNAPYTAYNLDRAVEQLATELTWAVWSPRTQSVSETRLIEGTNESELPLDASESQMRRASKNQLLDLSKRRGEFTKNRRGSFGSAFIEPTF